ncbi:M15 family metallopeptidase [Cellulomonas sp. PSBB021]|uniref:M15 family metallopeptidase n=1 Tax=Cellulomonas sp. PSBB021 TaxID=2003551 RepID=UPI0012FD36FE|nr:M15 family metallopeptidase [Cellulomonas sp. PSBB021]
MVLATTAFTLADRSPASTPAWTADAGPSTVEALTATATDLTPPPSLVAQGAAERVVRQEQASRSASRLESQADATPDCDGVVTNPGTNGRVPDSELCDLWQRPYRDRADAAESLFSLNAFYVARFGEPMCLSSGYRSYEEQAALRRKKGGIAAPAGLSNHGWGLAVDFCSETYAGERGDWLWANAATFGWENPEWARKGGSGYYEPWHWEYKSAVEAMKEAGTS